WPAKPAAAGSAATPRLTANRTAASPPMSWPRDQNVLSRATTEVRGRLPAPAAALVPGSAGPAEAAEAAPVGADAAAAPGPPAAALPAAPPGPAVPASRSRSTRRRARTAATRMGRKEASPTSTHTEHATRTQLGTGSRQISNPRFVTVIRAAP